MRYIDFILQTIMFLLAIAILVATFNERDWPMGILLIQMYLGPYQMLSCLISIIAQADLWKAKLLHFTISSVYLFLLWIGSNSFGNDMSSTMVMVSLTVPAWILATFYYYISLNIVFPTKKKNRGSFLPNLSF